MYAAPSSTTYITRVNIKSTTYIITVDHTVCGIVVYTQQTRGIHPMLFQCWSSVEDDGPTLKQHWVNSPCFKGSLQLYSFNIIHPTCAAGCEFLATCHQLHSLPFKILHPFWRLVCGRVPVSKLTHHLHAKLGALKQVSSSLPYLRVWLFWAVS